MLSGAIAHRRSSGRNHPQIHFHRHSTDRALDLVFPGRGPGSDIGRTGEAHAAVPTLAKTISFIQKIEAVVGNQTEKRIIMPARIVDDVASSCHTNDAVRCRLC